MDRIKFGTDGWRGIIAQDFTYQNITRVAQAIADYVGRNKKAAVGYDTRFMSPQYAELIAAVLQGNKINTVISSSVTPTQMLSYYVKYKGLSGGIMVTASHNPAIYNGIKFKEPYGCSSLPATTRKIESLLDKNAPQISGMPVKKEDFSGPYLRAVKGYLRAGAMKRKPLRIVVDSMYGAGGFFLSQILKQYGHRVITIHGEANPLFPGINPEPVGKNLKELTGQVKELNADIGIATDGDADRVGIVDDKGRVLTPHQVLALLLLQIYRTRQWDGAVVKTISTTSLINRIADKYGIPVTETPVGFKYIAKLMLDGNVLIGGEESGGNGFKNHIPERDGILSGLLIVEMIGTQQKDLSALTKELEDEYGRYGYGRIDRQMPRDKIDRMFNRINNNPPAVIAGMKVAGIHNYDGTKFIFSNGAWMLLRASGTEPVLRIYAEAPSPNGVKKLIREGKKMAGL